MPFPVDLALRHRAIAIHRLPTNIERTPIVLVARHGCQSCRNDGANCLFSAAPALHKFSSANRACRVRVVPCDPGGSRE